MPPRNPTVSRDLKARIPILRFELGLSVKEICKILGVRKSFVYKTLRYYCIYGTTVNPHTRWSFGRRKLSQIDLAFIRDMIAQQHSLYLDEIQQELVARRGILVSIPTLVRTLRRLDFSHKKASARATERNELMRAAFMNKIGSEVLDPNMLMFTDETAKDEQTSGRRMGWSKVGTQCVQRRCFVRGQRYSILPVLTLDGLITWDIIEGSVTSERFVQFLRENVIPLTNPYPGPRSVLILNNCSIHHAEEVRQLVEEEAQCKLIFLPSYSPDYNPIEQAFSCIKAWLRRNYFDKSLTALSQACQHVTPEMAAGFFRSSGYI